MSFNFKPLDSESIYERNNSIALSVFSVLRVAIVTMKLLPGNSISEAEVAKQLGVSRQPVREAFIRLSRIGMMKIIPQKGSFIVKISEKDVENARFIREAIEVAIVQRACLTRTEEHIDRLFTIIDKQNLASESENHEKFLYLDDSFHRTIALSADCLFGWDIVENLKAQMDRVRFLSLPEATPMSKIVDQHQEITQALKSRDLVYSNNAITEHLNEISNSLVRLAEKHKDMFS